MSAEPHAPEAWREALGEDAELERELLERLPDLLDGTLAPPRGSERLLRSVAQAPLKFAPFFGRIAELWDVSEERVAAVLAPTDELSAWKRTPLPGVRLIEVAGGPRTQGAATFLVRFAPGVYFPKHRHPGDEALFVIQGSYTDSHGRVVGPGDLHAMSAGSEHAFRVAPAEACIGAAVQRGREFTSLFMRILAKIFDD